MIERAYSVAMRATWLPTLNAAALLEVRGEPVPGVTVQARMKVLQVPDLFTGRVSVGVWSDWDTIEVQPDGMVRLREETLAGGFELLVRPAVTGIMSRLSGTGSAWATKYLFGRDVRVPVNAVAVMYAESTVVPEPPPAPEEPDDTVDLKPAYDDAVDLSQAEWWGEGGPGLPITAGLQVEMVYPKHHAWFAVDGNGLSTSNCTACFFVLRDGRWVGGAFDGMEVKGGRGRYKTLNNVRSGYPAKHGKGHGSEEARRAYIRPKHGEMVAWCVISKPAKRRTHSVLKEYRTS